MCTFEKCKSLYEFECSTECGISSETLSRIESETESGIESKTEYGTQ